MEEKEKASIILEFPDPFSVNADPATYEVIEPGGGGKGAKGAIVSDTPARKQIKGLRCAAAEVADARAGAGAGSYEVQMGTEAVESGLFTLTNDKGNLTPGGDMKVDIACTLPQPKGIGGLQVGSWKTFPCAVVLKGGWKPDGDSDENSVPFFLRAFVGF